MRSRSVHALFSFLLITLWLATAPIGAVSASAEKQKKEAPPYALIFGTVWDAQGRPAYGIPIKIRRADQKKAKWTLISDHRGEFAQRVPAGKADYVVWADVKPKKSPKDAKPVETTAHIDNDERIDVSLHLTE
jgi:hypothetical protein